MFKNLQALYALLDVQLVEFPLPQDWKKKVKKSQAYKALKQAKPNSLKTVVR